MGCITLYHLQNSKRGKIHGGELLLVKLQALGCNITKSNTLPWVFFTFFTLYIIGTKSCNACDKKCLSFCKMFLLGYFINITYLINKIFE